LSSAIFKDSKMLKNGDAQVRLMKEQRAISKRRLLFIG
jgi:hypothetical protein